MKDTLTPSELKQIKEICVMFNAQSVTIVNVKYNNLPLNKWKNETEPSLYIPSSDS